MANHRINELNREVLICETNYEKEIYKIRIARLASKLIKINLGFTKKYQVKNERKDFENILTLVGTRLEEWLLPGGGSTYLYLKEELKS